MPKKLRSLRFKKIYLSEEGLGESTHINFVFTSIYIHKHIAHVCACIHGEEILENNEITRKYK